MTIPKKTNTKDAAAAEAALQETVGLLVRFGSTEYTPGEARYLSNAFDVKMNQSQVEKICERLGLRRQSAPASTGAKTSSSIDTMVVLIAGELKQLCAFPKVAHIDDMYAFLAHMDGNSPEDAGVVVAYRRMPTNALQTLAAKLSIGRAARNDPQGSVENRLLSQAKTSVFDSDDHRKAYDQYLVTHSSAMTELFTKLAKVPDGIKRNPWFADKCIAEIMRIVGASESDALDIYNKEAHLSIPYEPVGLPKTGKGFAVRCDVCGALTTFLTESDATRLNKCANCGRQVFKKCEHCGNNVLASAESCPHCRWFFPATGLFDSYCRQAEQARIHGRFDEARLWLSYAKDAATSQQETAKAKTVEKAIIASETPYKAHMAELDRIRTLVGRREYYKAKTALAAIPADIGSEVTDEVNDAIQKADALFKEADTLSGFARTNKLTQILAHFIDYEPAVDALKGEYPPMCSNVKVTPSADSNYVTVSWDPVRYVNGVRYLVIRKKGAEPPASVNDGDEIFPTVTKDGRTSVVPMAFIVDKDGGIGDSCKDTDLIPGQAYSYAVFTTWEHVNGIFSKPAIGEWAGGTDRHGAIYPCVKRCKATQMQTGKSLQISWTLPEHSYGVTIDRLCEGKRITLPQVRGSLYMDSYGIEYGKKYVYEIQAIYTDGGKSPVARCEFTPLPVIDAFTFTAAPVENKENSYRISWPDSLRRYDVDLKVLINDKNAYVGRTSDNGATITLTVKGKNIIKLAIMSTDGTWKESTNTETAYYAYSIDRKATAESYDETPPSPSRAVFGLLLQNRTRYQIGVKLSGDINKNVAGFYYVISQGSSAKWASQDDVNEHQFITNEVYLEKGLTDSGFWDGNSANTALYITVFTKYLDGGVSPGSHCRVERSLKTELSWEVKKTKLQISAKTAGGLVTGMPQLVLYLAPKGSNPEDTLPTPANTIMTIPEHDVEPAVQKYKQTYELQQSQQSKIDTLLKAGSYPDGACYVLRPVGKHVDDDYTLAQTSQPV